MNILEKLMHMEVTGDLGVGWGDTRRAREGGRFPVQPVLG